MSEKDRTFKNIKMISLSIVMLLAVGYLWATYSYWTNGGNDKQVAASTDQRRDAPRENRNGGRPEFDRDEMRKRMAADLNLTPEQEKQMEAIRARMEEADGRPNPRAMMEAAREILTPEQQAKAQEMRQGMGGRMAQRMAEREAEARKTLSDADFAAWKKKAEERRQEMEARFANGEGPRGPRGGEGGEPRGGGGQDGGRRGNGVNTE